jgi:hypothetical protein
MTSTPRSRFPAFSLDISGMKLSAPGVLGNWLRGTGANAVDGALTTFYTDIQTGVSDGALTLALGACRSSSTRSRPTSTASTPVSPSPARSPSTGTAGTACPRKSRTPWFEAGKYYTVSHGEDMLTATTFALNKMVELGAEQTPPVTIVPMPAEERQKWVDMLPNLAGEWADGLEAEGIPARAFLSAYMESLREAGEAPLRDWDK